MDCTVFASRNFALGTSFIAARSGERVEGLRPARDEPRGIAAVE